MNECDFFKWMSAELFGLAGFFWGGMDGLLTALLVFMVLDYVSGVVIAYKEKRLSSEVGFWGQGYSIYFFSIYSQLLK
ncbi:MAG: phage holin family protein [Oscillospiraceae bacterium]